jgi:hypothetical protein
MWVSFWHGGSWIDCISGIYPSKAIIANQLILTANCVPEKIASMERKIDNLISSDAASSAQTDGGEL